MSQETVEEPKTQDPVQEPEKTPTHTSPNMQFKNKYAVGDELWVVFTNGPLLRVNRFQVKSLNCEVIGFDKPNYLYGFSIAADGHGDAVNLTFVDEPKCFFDRQSAEKKALTLIGDVMAEYDKEIEAETKRYEKVIGNLNEQRGAINANELIVPDRVVQAPTQDPAEKARQIARDANAVADKIEAEKESVQDAPGAQVAQQETKTDPVTPVKTPETPNPESDVEQNQTTEQNNGQ